MRPDSIERRGLPLLRNIRHSRRSELQVVDCDIYSSAAQIGLARGTGKQFRLFLASAAKYTLNQAIFPAKIEGLQCGE